MATFTKNKTTGNYDVIGTPDEVQSGSQCVVTKRDGSTTTVTIDRVGKSFKAKFGPLQGKEAVIGTVSRSGGNGGGSSGKRCAECGTSISGRYEYCRDCIACELCGENKFKCGHCIGW